MAVDIFAYPFGFEIKHGYDNGEPIQGSIFVRHPHMYTTKNNKIKKTWVRLEEFIPETCEAINLYCNTDDTPLDQIMNVVSYAHHIGAALTIHTYDSSKLEGIEDWGKINNNIKFNVDIVF